MTAFFVLGLPAAQSPTATVEGRVIDASTNAGIAGAVVDIVAAGSGQILRTVHTDGEGSFHFDSAPGVRLNVTSRADGYEDDHGSIQITLDSGVNKVILPLARTAAISGKVVDEDTGMPVPKVRVWPKQAIYLRGRLELRLAAGAVVAGDDGAFVARNLPPGEYVLELNGSLTADDVSSRIREGYPRTFWPGPGNLEAVVPIDLPSGATMNVGTLELRKREFLNVSVSVTSTTCATGRTYEAQLVEKAATSQITSAAVRVACGGSATFRNVDPGDYWVEASPPQPEDNGEFGIAPISVINRDVETSVAVAPPIAFHGRVLLDGQEGSIQKPELPPGLRVFLPPPLPGTGGYTSPFGNPEGTVSPDGSFELSSHVLPDGRIQAIVSGAPRQYYVKEVRYNGIVSSGSIFVLNAAAMQQELEIVCSDRAGALSGKVRDEDGNGVGDAAVLLAPWPPSVVSRYPYDAKETRADSSGNFVFTGLRPGSFRAVAVPPADRALLEQPGNLMGLLEATDSFEIKEAAAQYSDLKVTRQPRR